MADTQKKVAEVYPGSAAISENEEKQTHENSLLDASLDLAALEAKYGINEKKFLRKLDLKLLPVLTLLYLLSFLDRSNGQ
jgi:hypothetical protein